MRGTMDYDNLTGVYADKGSINEKSLLSIVKSCIFFRRGGADRLKGFSWIFDALRNVGRLCRNQSKKKMDAQIILHFGEGSANAIRGLQDKRAAYVMKQIEGSNIHTLESIAEFLGGV